MKKFQWERGPFEQCVRCEEKTMGILAAQSCSVHLRCTNCGEAYSEILPKLNKRVLYLDQNLFSVLFKVQSGGRLPIGHEAFSKAAYQKLRRAVLLQQAVMPHSMRWSRKTGQGVKLFPI